MASVPEILRMEGVTKRFSGVLANDHVSLDVRAGEIHALLGENGAGKSTLMKILYGLHAPDSGEIFIDGHPVDISSPRVAVAHGIGASATTSAWTATASIPASPPATARPRRAGSITTRCR